jgi:hypothetical protein
MSNKDQRFQIAPLILLPQCGHFAYFLFQLDSVAKSVVLPEAFAGLMSHVGAGSSPRIRDKNLGRQTS